MAAQPGRLQLVENLANTIATRATAQTIYGTPIERHGITVIPVGKVRYGLGGGSGTRNEDVGSGGGGGVDINPVGFIEIKDGFSKFRRINYPSFILEVIAGLSIGLWLVLRGMRALKVK